MRGISRVRRVQYCLRRDTDIVRRKTGAGKRAFQVRKIENWFSVCKPHVGANKKYVRHILKYKAHIFRPLKTRPAGAGDQWPFGHKTICLLAPKMQTKRRHGRDESCIYGERQAG